MALTDIVGYVLHIDKHLSEAITNYGIWIYLILFIIVFLETGFVVTPFLPGDSLLFAAGAFAAIGKLNVFIIFLSLLIAAILGDTINYWIGHVFGKKAFKENSKFFKKEYLDRTGNFYKKYGRKTVVIARFMPIIRTFAPFIAGICVMNYPTFLTYNIIGGLLWVSLFVFGGYFFGNIPFVQDNFSLVILAIIFLSILPAIIEYIREKRKR
jgi:membrane-associated protein